MFSGTLSPSCLVAASSPKDGSPRKRFFVCLFGGFLSKKVYILSFLSFLFCLVASTVQNGNPPPKKKVHFCSHLKGRSGT